jgi:hypothetical protein
MQKYNLFHSCNKKVKKIYSLTKYNLNNRTTCPEFSGFDQRRLKLEPNTGARINDIEVRSKPGMLIKFDCSY